MTVERQHKASGVDGALRWIGDLDHPFYQDERRRFIWYEASAIGFQLMLSSQFLIGGIASWSSDEMRRCTLSSA